MIDLNISARNIEKAAKHMDLSVDIVTRRIALDLYGRITKKTPVDTGRARANWNLSIGSPDYSIEKTDVKSTGKHKNKTSPPSTPKPKKPKLKRGDGMRIIYITNNLPYISALEYGHSKQAAPHAMVRKSVQEVTGFF